MDLEELDARVVVVPVDPAMLPLRTTYPAPTRGPVEIHLRRADHEPDVRVIRDGAPLAGARITMVEIGPIVPRVETVVLDGEGRCLHEHFEDGRTVLLRDVQLAGEATGGPRSAAPGAMRYLTWTAGTTEVDLDVLPSTYEPPTR